MKTLWSLRWSVARGWQYKNERQVTDDTAEAWLTVYRIDEPGVTFIVSKNKPKVAKG